MNSRTKTLKCRTLVNGRAEGEAIVSREAVCFYLCDPETGELLDKNHHLKGQSLAERARRLTAIRAPQSWITMVRETVSLDDADRRRSFGESLPPGLKLI